MSRSGFSEDADYESNWPYIIWRGRVASAMRGKRGQRLLLDLVEALDALPEKRLITEELIRETGEVCALGAVGLKRGVVMWSLNPDPDADGYDDEIEKAEEVAAAFDVAPCLVREITYLNDEAWWRITPEERWRRMRAWAVSHLEPVDIVEDDPLLSIQGAGHG
jgi:hypothetical protein